jgi:hypothetical protein
MYGSSKVFVPETYKLTAIGWILSLLSKSYKRQHILKSLDKIIHDYSFYLVKRTIESSKSYVPIKVGTKRSRVSKSIGLSVVPVSTIDIQPVFTPVYYDCTDYHGPMVTKDGLVLPVTNVQKDTPDTRTTYVFFRPNSDLGWRVMGDWIEELINTGFISNPISDKYNDIIVDDAWVYGLSDIENIVKLSLSYTDGLLNPETDIKVHGSLIMEMAGLSQQDTVDSIRAELNSTIVSCFTTQEGKMLSVVYELVNSKFVIVSSKVDYDSSAGVMSNHTHGAVSQFLKGQRDERAICIQKHSKFGFDFCHFILA